MESIYQELQAHKCKHNLLIEVGIKTYESSGTGVTVTVFDKDFNNKCIFLYDFFSKEENQKLVDQAKELMNNKSKALKFIKEGY